ncbi:MAG: protein kinase, partial [Myxococcota bacterium]
MRYALEGSIGSGGFADVFDAIDRRTGARVVVKRLRDPADAVAARREALALRILRVPGVVRALDHGVDADGRSFVVLERIDGAPFPGTPGPVSWPALAPVALALVRTVARVHRAGVLHRDLTPANVRVRPSGEVVLVDFGLASGPALGAAAETAGGGTARYLAPECLLGAAPSVRSEVYAVGTMLHEALGGAPAADRWTDPPRLHGVPDVVADAIARAVAASPAGRTPDLPALAVALGGFGTADLPWFGDRAAIDVARGVLAAGGGVRLVGAPGSGRDRAIAEVVGALGLDVVALGRSDLPFGSLPASLRPDGGRLESLPAQLRATLAARSGIALVGWWAAIDRWTRALLASGPGAPWIAAADERERDDDPGGHRVQLAPCAPDAMADWFCGPERVVHRRTDGARRLGQATGGHRGRIAAAVTGWVADGAATVDAGRIRW